ncbi:MAG TPA: MFS transporter [Chloroflexota bacterium]|jgi:EmrB/QacA subfamily drug resistance transporter
MATPAPTAEVRRAALVVATISAFLTPFLGSSVSVALPTIGRDFHMDAIALSWISTAYLLAAAVALVPIGRIADIHGRKRIWLYGVILYTGASVLCAAAPSGAWLIAFRCLQAIGSTLIYGTGLAVLTSVFPREQRGRVIGFNVAAVYTGLSVGPFVGGLLTTQWGWRSMFLSTVPFGLIAIYLILTRLKGEWAEARGERFDVVGTILYGLALVVLMYGLSALPAIRGAALAAAGVAGLAAFTWWELHTPDPVLEMRLFRDNLVFALSNLAALINYGATVAVTFLLSLYLQYVQGMSPAEAGLVLVSQPVVMMLVSLQAGRLSDRVEPRIVVSAGMAITAAGLLGLVWLTPATPLAFIVAMLVVQGIGFGLFSSPNANAIMSAVAPRYYGVASGILSTMRATGQMVGMAITMVVVSLYIGQEPVSADNLPAFIAATQTACLLFAVLTVGGVVASLVRGKVPDADPAPDPARGT